jgi:carbamate kinase
MKDGASQLKVALVALGGNALLQRGEDPTAENQARSLPMELQSRAIHEPG